MAAIPNPIPARHKNVNRAEVCDAELRRVRRRAGAATTHRAPRADEAVLAGQPVHRAGFRRSLRIAADLAPSRSDGARAARQEQGVLHDRLERARRQRDGRAADAAHRSGVPALSLRRVHGRAFSQAARPRSDHGFGAELRGKQGRSGFRRPPQGVGLQAALGVAADLDDRLAPAEGIRYCGRDRAGAAHRPRAADSGRFDRDLLVRRCIVEPRDRADRIQRRAVDRVPEAAGAGAVRLRGQRHRHLGEDAGRLDRECVRASRRPRLFLRRRARSRRRLRRGRARRLSLPHDAPADVPASAHDADHGSRRHRFRDRMAQRRGTGRGRSRPIRCCARRRSRSNRAWKRRIRCSRSTRRSARSALPPPRRPIAGRS